MARRVQLALPAGRLLVLAPCPADGIRMLVVLLLQVYRVLRHVLLRDAQAVRSGVDAARHPPWHHAHVRLVGCKVYSRWSQLVLRSAEYLRAHHHVRVLHAGRDGTEGTEVPLVEEVSHRAADGSVHPRYGSRLPAADLERLQLSERVRLLHRCPCGHVLLPVLELLQTGVRGPKTGQEGKG
uniref:Putative secreted protein n=1 Tax=Anopheles marajoara TaxID=58244 RepID=A0A2M4C5W0_9DIPT